MNLDELRWKLRLRLRLRETQACPIHLPHLPHLPHSLPPLAPLHLSCSLWSLRDLRSGIICSEPREPSFFLSASIRTANACSTEWGGVTMDAGGTYCLPRPEPLDFLADAGVSGSTFTSSYGFCFFWKCYRDIDTTWPMAPSRKSMGQWV